MNLSIKFGKIGLSIVLCVILAGCATVSKSPDLDTLYTRSATYPRPQRNPVIIIPGVLGSKFKDTETDKIVWGAFSGKFTDPSTKEGARLIALPMKEGVPLRELKDSVISDGTLDRFDVNVVFLPMRLNAYYNILKILGIAGYRDEDIAKSGTVKYPKGHFTSFQFDYDWRRDIMENAKLLDEFIQQHRKYIQDEVEKRFGIKGYDVKFDIIAHSMGGLLARYYLRYGPTDLPEDGSHLQVTWAGCKHIRRLIMVGTPNAGSVAALVNLINGYKKTPFVPYYPPAIIGTMPSFYQLLPQTRHRAVVRDGDLEGEPLDIFNPKLWEEMQWGLASPEQDKVLKILLPEVKEKEKRRGIALDHQRKCLQRAKHFLETLSEPADPPEGISIDLFAGDAISTDAVVAVDMKNGSLKVIEKAPGDGLVLRSSALMDERRGSEWSPRLVSPIKWSKVIFLFTDHLGMTEDPAFIDNILYYLLEHPE